MGGNEGGWVGGLKDGWVSETVYVRFSFKWIWRCMQCILCIHGGHGGRVFASMGRKKEF